MAAALAALAGCGGSSEASAPTKAAFIVQADAICRSADKKQEAGLESFAKSHPLEELKGSELQDAIMSVGMPPIEEEAKELGELTPPSGEEAELEAFVTGIEKAVKQAEANPQSMASETSSPFKPVDALAAKYGFKDCSESS